MGPSSLTRRPGARLTASCLATLPPGTHTDPAQLGLQVRVTERKDKRRTTSYLLRVKFRGDETRLLLGHHPEMSLDAARAAARALREQAARGIDPRRARPARRPAPVPRTVSAAATSPDVKHSIDFLAQEFIEKHLRTTRKRPEYAEAIIERDVLPDWRGRDARTIKPREVIELLDKIVGRGSRVMANRAAAVVGQLFRYGVHRAIVEASPVTLLYRPGGKEKPRERTLSDDELRAFLRDPKAATRFDKLAHVMLLLLLTGQRRGELAAARWAEIDFDSTTWTIPAENSKTGRGHAVPLSAWAVREFRALQQLALRSKWVLPAPGGEHAIDPKQLTRSLARCMARFTNLGIAAPFTLHDLRRTCRTGLAQLGILPHIAERVLNHAQEKIVGTYDLHGYLVEKREALEQWAAHLDGLRR